MDPKNVLVVGWSHGGSTVTGVVRPEALGRSAAGPHFRAAIAFYPGCCGAYVGGHEPSRLKSIDDVNRFLDQSLAR